MRMKVLSLIFFVIFSSGCATAHKGQDIQVQQFQNRINNLEAELQRKNQKLSTLEAELHRRGEEIIELEEELEKTKVSTSSSTLRGQRENALPRLSVRQIQTALKNAGFYKGPIDGKMGPRTKEALKDFQKSNGLTSDGIAGKQTCAKLTMYLVK